MSVAEFYGHTMIILLDLFFLSGVSFVMLVSLGRHMNLGTNDTLMDFDSVTY
jgi:hypothetical protein